MFRRCLAFGSGEICDLAVMEMGGYVDGEDGG